MHINARTTSAGGVRVSLYRGDGEMDGQPLENWDDTPSADFTGDTLDHVVGWTDIAGLDTMRGQAVRLLFELEQAEMFSFWFED